MTRSLSEEQRAGLYTTWYAVERNGGAVTNALRRSFLKHFDPRVAEALRRNDRANSHRPRNYRQLIPYLRVSEGRGYTDKGRSRKSLLPEAFGDKKLPPIQQTLKRYAHAAALGVAETDLSPAVHELIGYAAVYFVRAYDEGFEEEAGAALAYGHYVASHPPRCPDGLDAATLGRVYEEMGLDAGRDLDVIGRLILDLAGRVGFWLLTYHKNLIDSAPDRGA